MMMVVVDPRFIECGGVRRLDAPYQPHLHQGMKIIVNGLPGKTAKAFPGGDSDGVGVEMPAAVDRRQDGEAGRGDVHPRRAQPFLEALCIRRHGTMMALNLEFVKKKIVSGKAVCHLSQLSLVGVRSLHGAARRLIQRLPRRMPGCSIQR